MAKISVVVLSNGDPLNVDQTLSGLVPEKAGHQVILAHPGPRDLIEPVLERRHWVDVVAGDAETEASVAHAVEAAEGDVIVFVPAGSRLQRGWGERIPSAGSNPKWEAGSLPALRQISRLRGRITRSAGGLFAPFRKSVLPGQAIAARSARLKDASAVDETIPGAAESTWARLASEGVPLGKLPVSCILPPGGLVSSRSGVALVYCQKVLGVHHGAMLADAGTARMERALIGHSIRTVQAMKTSIPVWVGYHPDDPQAAIQVNAGEPYRIFAQQGNTPAERLESSVARVARYTSGAILAVRTHCPSLRAASLDLAMRKLNAYDVVLGPSDEGDCYLIAMARNVPGLLTGYDWEEDGSLSELIARVRAAGLRYTLVEPLRDLDSFEDFRHHYLMGYIQ